MRRRTVVAVVFWLLGVSTLAATAAEPDGRVAFRYEWVDDADAPKGERRLRVSMTSHVALEEARLEASAPSGASSMLRSWSAEGISLGSFGAATSIVLELDVVEPPDGGEILTLELRALEHGEPIREAVGVPVGEPGVKPTLRNGAMEFQAVRDGTRP